MIWRSLAMCAHVWSSRVVHTCRCCIIGSITGNRNTLAGNIPPQADLGNLEGFEAGFKYPNVMINAGEWEAPKAYKDAKVRCDLLFTLLFCLLEPTQALPDHHMRALRFERARSVGWLRHAGFCILACHVVVMLLLALGCCWLLDFCLQSRSECVRAS